MSNTANLEKQGNRPVWQLCRVMLVPDSVHQG